MDYVDTLIYGGIAVTVLAAGIQIYRTGQREKLIQEYHDAFGVFPTGFETNRELKEALKKHKIGNK